MILLWMLDKCNFMPNLIKYLTLMLITFTSLYAVKVSNVSAARNKDKVIVNNYICGDDKFVSETVLKITATNNGYGGRVAQLSINNQKFDGWYYKGIFTTNKPTTVNSPSLHSWYKQEGIHRHLIYNNIIHECVPN